MSKYTKEQIEAMTPEQLKRAVATDVMGLSIYHYDKDVESRCFYMLWDEHCDPVARFDGMTTGERKTEELAWADCPDYIGNVTAAWLVMDAIKEKHDHIGLYYSQCMDDRWTFAINDIVDGEDGMPDMNEALFEASTASEAICKAALLAVKDEEKKPYFNDPDDGLPF
jgi:hypothetical protein